METEPIETEPIKTKCLNCQLTCKQPINVIIYKCNYKPLEDNNLAIKEKTKNRI